MTERLRPIFSAVLPQIAFYFSFALFPLLIFVISLLGMILETSDDIRKELFAYLYQIMPRDVFNLVRTTIDEIVDKSSGGKATVGLVFTLWSASAGFDAARTALNNVYQLRETRSWWRTKLQSLALTFIVTTIAGFLLAVVFLWVELVGTALGSIGIEITSPLVLMSIQWITALAMVFFVCELIYNLLPNFKTFRWLRVTPGSIVAIILWILLSTGFRTYLAYYNSYNKAYGSLGAVIIMMLWLYLSAAALTVGGVINSVFEEMKITTVEPDDGEKTTPNIRSLLEAVFLLLIFSLGFMQPEIEFRGISLNVTEAIFIAASCLWLVAFFLKQVKIRWNPIYILFGLYALGLFLSAAFSENSRTSFIKYLGELYLIGLAVLTFNVVDSERILKRVVFAWLAASTVTAFIGVVTVVMFYLGLESWVSAFPLTGLDRSRPATIPASRARSFIRPCCATT